MYKFQPILKSLIWGGEKIAPYKGIATDQRNIGESWELSGVKDNESVVAEGPEAGTSLPELIARHGAALQIPLLHQAVHVYRHKVRFDLADLHDIPGCGAVRVVGQKHQDIKGGLGQLEFLTQRLAHGAVRLRGLEADLYGRVHGTLLLFLYGQFIFEVL